MHVAVQTESKGVFVNMRIDSSFPCKNGFTSQNCYSVLIEFYLLHCYAFL